MNKMLILSWLLAFCGHRVPAQTNAVTREAFVNEIFNQVADSSLSKYYLLKQSIPCSFKRYDFDEWMKYGLKEMITIDILNELAEKSYRDTARVLWDQQNLARAICIQDQDARKILNPLLSLENNKELSASQKRRAIRKRWKAWNRKPLDEKLVFCFSKPEFTADYQFAVIDVSFKCDDKACGMGATYIFRRNGQSWKIAGERTAWAN
jgi:hypothetical protein